MNKASFRVDVPVIHNSVVWFGRTVQADTAEEACEEVKQMAISSGYPLDRYSPIRVNRVV